MFISSEFIESICINTIETILLCLSHATKGTIYAIGPPPGLRAVRIKSGIRDVKDGRICWGLPETSDYNPPGKFWSEYRDNPGMPLEAMGWCVEKQKSWTADNPFEDVRSVRKQLQGEIEDYHHMEPVLVKKVDLFGTNLFGLEYPRDWQGNLIWQDTDYIVVAVIKIHFEPQSIRQGDNSTKIIKKLSRTLGTELLSFYLKENYLKAQENLSRQRIQSANALAHELRNSLIKLGFVFFVINGLMGFLREGWEAEVQKRFPLFESKEKILRSLDEILQEVRERAPPDSEISDAVQVLLNVHFELASLPFLPMQAQNWIHERMRLPWGMLLSSPFLKQESRETARGLLASLQESIFKVMSQETIDAMSHLPEPVRRKWPELAYTQFTMNDLDKLNEVEQLLDDPGFRMHRKRLLKKMITSLHVIAQVITHIERQTNTIIHSLKTGEDM